MTLRRLRVLLRALPFDSEFKTEVRAAVEDQAVAAKTKKLEDAQDRYQNPQDGGSH